MNIIKSKILAAAAAGLVIGGTAQAAEMADVRPYVGAELSFNMPKYNNAITTTGTAVDIKKNKLGGGINAGAKICEYFGVEIGYNQVMKAKNGNYSGRIKNLYLDGMGYFAANPDINLIASVGVGRLKQSISGFDIVNGSATKAKISYRLGLGAEYKFDENVTGRLMFRHQKGNKDFLKNMNSIALGVSYTF
jgi:opacity protein-like surface antigen